MSIEKIDENILVIQQQEARIRELEHALDVAMNELFEANRHIQAADLAIRRCSRDEWRI